MKKLFIPFAFVATFCLFAFANSEDSNTPVTKFMNEATSTDNTVFYNEKGKTILTKECWYIHCVPPTKLTENEVKNIIAKY